MKSACPKVRAEVLRPTTETSWISGYKLLDQTLLIDRE